MTIRSALILIVGASKPFVILFTEDINSELPSTNGGVTIVFLGAIGTNMQPIREFKWRVTARVIAVLKNASNHSCEEDPGRDRDKAASGSDRLVFGYDGSVVPLDAGPRRDNYLFKDVLHSTGVVWKKTNPCDFIQIV